MAGSTALKAKGVKSAPNSQDLKSSDGFIGNVSANHTPSSTVRTLDISCMFKAKNKIKNKSLQLKNIIRLDR